MNVLTSRANEAIDLLMTGEVGCVGTSWVPIVEGSPRWPSIEGSIANWKERLLTEARPIRIALEERCEEITSSGGRVVELMPGIWAVGCAHQDNQHEHVGIALLISDELLDHGSLSMLCNAAMLDETLVRNLAESMDFPSGESIVAMAALVRRLHQGSIDRIRNRDAQVSVDRRLSDSYEELHLLNSLIDGLVLGGDTEEFLRKACVELAATAGYRWIALLVDSAGSSILGDNVLHGEGVPTRSELRRIADLSGGAVSIRSSAHSLPQQVSVTPLSVAVSGSRTTFRT